MIYGVGSDLISLERIRYALSAFGNKFLQRILTRNELNYYIEMHNEDNKIAFLAKRFAAKEAISKALGTGIGESLSFKDIEISNNEEGKPLVKVERFPDIKIHLSLSDEKEGLAMAFAIAEK
jgi:holo-[acyl-carrier protein] synthase